MEVSTVDVTSRASTGAVGASAKVGMGVVLVIKCDLSVACSTSNLCSRINHFRK